MLEFLRGEVARVLVVAPFVLELLDVAQRRAAHLAARLAEGRGVGLHPRLLVPGVEVQERGHNVAERPSHSGDAQTIMVLPDGSLSGVADPRRGGVAASGLERPRRPFASSSARRMTVWAAPTYPGLAAARRTRLRC